MRAPKTKGIGWDVFECSGSSDGELQIQVINEPEFGDERDDKYGAMTPAFRDDAAAIRHVIRLAEAGVEEALDALWEVLPHDGLVNRIFWQMNFPSFPIKFPGEPDSL